MALTPETEKFHTMSPKEIGLKETSFIHVARTTSHTGEQFQIAVPLYPEDTREAFKNRLGVFLSIIQDRMEDENKAVVELEQRAIQSRVAKERIKSNMQTFLNKKKALDKKAHKSKMDPKVYEENLAMLQTGLKSANMGFEEQLRSLGEMYTPPNEEAPKEN